MCVGGRGGGGERRVYVHMCLYFCVCLYSVCVCVCARARACVRIFVHNSVMKYNDRFTFCTLTKTSVRFTENLSGQPGG